ncbi:TetR/AcrR family transcriptional regulator [Asaia spathodeae]|uniref:TetR/AcrR family transcriptional regulator n=1 Tax=Asaia spathodeae TaxID=657016 RepID=A0ABX2P849_9PROT|nr:TetR/AcrR family transcriptional regulator [Asaia spathodeae]GBR12839.1 transcriptional regulator [Asaia spathodeae NBRC 105894]
MSRGNYHHGDLKAALVAAAETIIRDEGVEGFTLRKAASHAGVSPGAPSHHFGDMRGLLTALAIRVFGQLGAALSAYQPTDRAACNLRNQAEGYVRFAAANPGLFRLICRVDLINGKDPALLEASFVALEGFGKAIAVYFDGEAPDRERRTLRPHLAGAMATAHGLAHMVIEGRPALLFETPDPVQTFLEESLPVILMTTWPDRQSNQENSCG